MLPLIAGGAGGVLTGIIIVAAWPHRPRANEMPHESSAGAVAACSSVSRYLARFR